MEEIEWSTRDALLLAFAELAGYGIATVAGAGGTADQARAEITAAIQARAPYAIGSYVFWLRTDEWDFAAGGAPPLYTSGPDVDRALAAALAHQGLGVAA